MLRSGVYDRGRFAVGHKHHKQVREHGRLPLCVERGTDFFLFEFTKSLLDDADRSPHHEPPCGHDRARSLLPQHDPRYLIPTDKIHDTFAHSRLVRVAMVFGTAMSAFQASQQASTISS